jgi:CSLREA domain-containing protein
MHKIILMVGAALALVAFIATLSPARSETAERTVAVDEQSTAASITNTFVVTDTSDAVDFNIGDGVCAAHTLNGDRCTLRAAIQEANTQYAGNPGTMYTISVKGGFIFGPPLLYPLTLTGPPEDNAATGDLDIKCNLFMYSTGHFALVSASGLGDRVFHIIQPPSGPISVTFVGIWMANGSAADHGGGLLIENNGSVTLDSVRVMTNSVTGQTAEGGGIDLRGGGTLTLNSVIVRANRVQGGNNGGARGGGIAASGRLIVNASTIVSNVVTENTSADNISGYGGGIDSECCPGTLVMSDSAVLDNNISLGSAAQFISGGGINASGSVTISHSTLSGNSLNAAGSNSTVIEGGGLYVNGRLSMISGTVDNNTVLASVLSLGMHGGGVAFNFHA